MTTPRRCPALLISAPASGQGKTTFTAALARLHRNQGRRVRVFKSGPDFLDPTILERASGQPVYQLDLWMGGEAHCRGLLYQAAEQADLILVEGVMGLFDGTPSSADLATRLGIPVLAVVDAKAMAQTFGALALGLARFRPELPFAGVAANRVGSPGHAQLCASSLPPELRFFGALPLAEECALPSRHLGLLPAEEIDQLDARLERAASLLAEGEFDQLPAPVSFAPAEPYGQLPRPLAGVRIAIARDAAFSFVYRANLDLLQRLGAELRPFSPLTASALPEADSLYLPGGYPELHLHRLAANSALHAAIHTHHRAGRPIVAECGGMLYLLESLTNHSGERAALVGLIPGHGQMQGRLANLGLHSLSLPEGEVRGHTFHHSTLESPLPPAAMSIPSSGRGRPEPLFRLGRLFASYLHLYLPANPALAAALFAPQPAPN